METKEKIKELFEKACDFHKELIQLAQEIDSPDMWMSEGDMQNVKHYLRTEYNNHL